ncbi:TetR/AcrR family transcriptional regulator [Anaerosporobacter faecicola]|uniref:TetR/AcrR family transcriptional regulator n=1 Tax=Anaerosporobacter faecicola TaxID=2718714 RepID=UPI00143B2082|nr:TetR/AcrR family transcriptional regulator [Anaerosporobacter faecicola]
MRVSKPPEERKKEMIDTAMRLFAQKGYEATTMTDIAKEMKVVSGLCYRYFRSKEELYQEALNSYAEECAAPMIQILNKDLPSVMDYMVRLTEHFRDTDGKEKYHAFFHREGNEMFHKQLELRMLSLLEQPVLDMVKRWEEKGFIDEEYSRSLALFILYGQMPIINDDTLTTEVKLQALSKFIEKLLR